MEEVTSREEEVISRFNEGRFRRKEHIPASHSTTSAQLG